MRWRTPSILITAALFSCSPGGEEEQGAPEEAMAQVQAAKDTLALAVASYDPTAFDTIAWDDSGAAVERGATVYRFSCQKCHGPNGDGEGDFVQAGDTIRPPSFQGEGWAFAEDRDGLREQIYIGSLETMPHWGLEGLKYRDVDAVAMYIQAELRH